MKNSLNDLNNYLFESLERLNDDSLDEDALAKEIKRSEAVTKVAGQIISNANVQLQALKHADEMGYNEGGRHLIGAIVPELEDKEEAKKKNGRESVAKRSKQMAR